MSLKSLVLGGLQRMNGLVGRVDLPAHEPVGDPGEPDTTREPAPQRGGGSASVQAPDSALASAEHLGVYRPLIAAIRDELEHFVASHVRLHLAIAERDRFLLTSIGVDCAGALEPHALLQQFMHEFKPEQVRRYLAREVIGGLPNAAAIDLSQFAGLFDAEAQGDADNTAHGGEYRELLEALRSTPASPVAPAFQVSLLGRWTELDFARPAASHATSQAPDATPTTPLAGQRCEFDIEDADGRRRVVLQAVVPGRRYVIGKGEGCDIRINGTYASRRHAEVWLDGEGWWVNDAGSTNGIRIESQIGVLGRSDRTTTGAGIEQPIKLSDGVRIVLSARAEGPVGDYPCVAMRSPVSTGSRITPIATMAGAPKTPLTAILSARPAESIFKLTAFQAAGVRTLELRPSALPVTVGRSRNQTLVVDRQHEGVSGYHLEITELDESGAQVVVHGDNGVLIEGVPYANGERFKWQVGNTMVLGASANDLPACTMTLTRHGLD